MVESDTRSHLARVYWIGGSPCAGKSSIARLVKAWFPVQVYFCDDALRDQGQRIDPEIHPVLHKWTTRSWDRLWMQPEGVLLREAVAASSEHFGLTIEDLLALRGSRPVVVEATALLPHLVSGVLAERHHAVWLAPSEGFRREHYRSRGDWVEGILRECSDRDQAFANWMDRDVAFGRWVAESVRELGLRVIEIDGTLSLAQTADLVARRFRLSDLAIGLGAGSPGVSTNAA